MDPIARRTLFVLCLMSLSPSIRGEEAPPANRIAHGDFQGSVVNRLPEGWAFKTIRPSLAPEFLATRENGRQELRVSGNGSPNCVGWVSTPVKIDRGKTYWLRARFRRSDTLDPLQHLLFMMVCGYSTQGISEYHRLDGNAVEVEGRIVFGGEGTAEGEMRILYRLCPDGIAWIENVSLTETTPVPPRWVRVGCTQGPARLEDYGLKTFAQALDVMGKDKVDLALMPEYMNGESTTETMTGPSVKLMSEKAAQHRMYVAGTIELFDPATDRLTNSALLFDRSGKLAGRYDKIHLYAPELHAEGVIPGDRVPIFTTDFGRVAFMTCYDSWYTDVAELAALRGADLLLFPNLGYDRGLMHARALDNRINIVTSTRSGKYGVWDTWGQDLIALPPEAADGTAFKDLVRTQGEAELGLLMVTVNLNAPSVQEWNGGSWSPVPRTRRNGSNSRVWLDDQIHQEKLRWWTNPPEERN